MVKKKKKPSDHFKLHTRILPLLYEVYKLSSGGACQILRLISTGGTQSR